MAKYPQWEYDLLRYLGTPAPLTNDGMDAQFPNSLLALNLWAQSEGSVTNNALATSGRGAGATTCVAQCGSTSPIYEYDNEADGVAQMGRFLQGSFYTKIVSSLLTNASLQSIYSAINSSQWCRGCQSGKYPEALAAAAGGGASGVSSTVGTGSTAGAQGGSGANAAGADLSQCRVPGPSFNFLFFSANTCLLSNGQFKAMTGALALAGGVVVGMFGVIVLAAYGFDRSGAKQAAAKVVGSVSPAGKALKVGSGAQKAVGGASSAPARSAPSTPPAVRTAGRRESRDIERQYRETERQQGPIGPRGASPTSTRVARDMRRGQSVQGARRRPTPTRGTDRSRTDPL